MAKQAPRAQKVTKAEPSAEALPSTASVRAQRFGCGALRARTSSHAAVAKQTQVAGVSPNSQSGRA